jgi:hypothetical protein
MHHHDGGHDVVLWAAAAVIAAGPFIAIGMDRWHGWILLGQRQGVTVAGERLVRLALAVLALGAAAAGVAGRPAAQEVLLAGSLLAWAVGIAASPRRWLPWLGLALGSLTAIASVASGDWLAAAFAVAIAVGAAALIAARERLATAPVAARSASLALLALSVSVVVLVAVTAIARV